MSPILSFMVILLSLNVNGIHDSMKWKNIFNTILLIALNVIALQETHLTHDQEYLFQHTLLNYHILFENGTSNSAGVLIALKQNCGIEIQSYSRKEGWFLSMICSWDNSSFKIINIYAPNDANKWNIFLKQLSEDLLEESIVLCGDFNSVMSSSDRISGRLDEISSLLNKLVRTHNLCEPQGFSQFTY